MKVLINKKNIFLAVVLVSYKVFLDYVYTTYISVTYSRYGFRYINAWAYRSILWLAWLATIVFLISLLNKKKISDLIIVFLTLLYFAPLNTFCSFSGVGVEFLLIYLFSFFILLLAQTYCPQISINYKLKVNLSDWFFWLVFVGSFLFICFVSYKYSGFRLFGINDSIYDIRSQAAGASMPGIIRYAWSNISYVLAFVIISAFMKKKYWMLPILAFEGYLVFSFAAHKSLLLIIVLVFAGCIMWENTYIVLIPLAFLADISFAAYETTVLCAERISHLATRRLLFDQCIIPYDFYKFFGEYPMDFFRQRFMRMFGDNSFYSEDIDRIMGERLFTEGCNANSGFLSDIFANMGYIGVIVLPIIIVLSLRLFDYSTRGIKKKYLIGFAAYFAMMIAESSYGSLVLSHGLAVTIILFLFVPKEERVNEIEE